MSEVHVRPDKGKWIVEEVDDDGKAKKVGSAIEDRKAAIEKAREAAGGLVEEMFDADGNPAGSVRSPGDRVVLCREDGSEYGELDPAAGEGGGTPQFVSIEPATENSSASEVS